MATGLCRAFGAVSNFAVPLEFALLLTLDDSWMLLRGDLAGDCTVERLFGYFAYSRLPRFELGCHTSPRGEGAAVSIGAGLPCLPPRVRIEWP